MVILDLNLPDRSGLDVLRDIHLTFPLLPVLVLSMYEEDQMALRAIKSGAKGYLFKGMATTDLISAITRILEGKHYVSDTVAELLANDCRNIKEADLVKRLSDREYFVLLRLASGETVSEISLSLMLSVKTIYTYRSRLMRKLNLKNMVEIIQFVKDEKCF